MAPLVNIMADDFHEDLPAGTMLLFDMAKQAYFPAGANPELSSTHPVLSRLRKAVRYEKTLGMRTGDIQFDLVERYSPPVE